MDVFTCQDPRRSVQCNSESRSRSKYVSDYIVYFFLLCCCVCVLAGEGGGGMFWSVFFSLGTVLKNQFKNSLHSTNTQELEQFQHCKSQDILMFCHYEQ